MSYVSNSLSRGEEIVYRAAVHWGIYILPAIIALLSPFLFFIPLIFAIPMAIGAWIYSVNTEMAVTNKKVIGKWGLIRRITIEQRLTKIDSISVEQGIFGRMLNYGSINVRGGGATNTPIKFIANPLDFKRQVEHAIEAAESNN